MKILSALAACCLFAVYAFADDSAEATAAVRNVTDSLLSQLKNRELYEKDQSQFYRMLENEVLGSVDMTLMSKLILRQHWKAATAEQQARFLHGFKNMLIESYGKSLLLLSDIQIKFVTPPSPPSSKPRKYQIVHTQVVTSDNQPPLSIDYYLIKRDAWLIFDLMMDGLSVVKQFRQSFAEEIAETGLDALIERLNGNFTGS